MQDRESRFLSPLRCAVIVVPLVDLLGKHRTKPGPFAVAVLIAFVLVQVLIFEL